MTLPTKIIAIAASDVPPRVTKSNYPPEFASRFEGRIKRQLGNHFDLSNFGVNLTTLKPGAMSALRHAHSKQDEFVFILEGEATLLTDAGTTLMTPGMCAGFKAGTGDAHQLSNRGTSDLLYLEIGDRSAGDSASYPDDDIQAVLGPDGKWEFSRKDGRRYS